jgi:hypothetical protein
MSIAINLNPALLKALVGCGAIIFGLALFCWLIILTDRRAAKLAAAAAAKAKKPQGRCPQRDWNSMADIVRAGLSQVEMACALHARAADRIDAAEYAFNRLLAECAALMGLPDAPAPRPVPVIAPRPAPYRPPLAA